MNNIQPQTAEHSNNNHPLPFVCFTKRFIFVQQTFINNFMNVKTKLHPNLAVTPPTQEQRKGILELIDLATMSEHGVNEAAQNGINYLVRVLKQSYPESVILDDTAPSQIG